jgi:hypothetical protein
VLALVLLAIPRVRRRTWMGGSALMVFALCLMGILGCGGGLKSGDTQNANATPVGTYSIQVTTSVGAASEIPPVTVSLTVTE